MPFRRDENDLGEERPVFSEIEFAREAARMNEEKFERAVAALDDPVSDVGPPDHRPFNQRGAFLGGARAQGTGVSGVSAGLAARTAVDPVGQLAGDLCTEAVHGGMLPETIRATARACREAAEICYGRWPSAGARRPLPQTAEEYRREVYGDFPPDLGGRRQGLGATDPDVTEILRQHATMEGIIERLDSDPEARRRRWGTLGGVPLNPGGMMPLGQRPLGSAVAPRPLGEMTREEVARTYPVENSGAYPGPEGVYSRQSPPAEALEGAEAVLSGPRLRSTPDRFDAVFDLARDGDPRPRPDSAGVYPEERAYVEGSIERLKGGE